MVLRLLWSGTLICRITQQLYVLGVALIVKKINRFDDKIFIQYLI